MNKHETRRVLACLNILLEPEFCYTCLTGNSLGWEFVPKAAKELYALRAGVDISKRKPDL
jgi:hypothetical protein